MTEQHIRRAGAQDADALTTTLATAFMTDPVSTWVFPDHADRERLHPGFFRTFLELALADGEVYATSDDAGVALWLPVDVNADDEEGDDVSLTIRQRCGDYHADRFAVLDGLMSANHPSHESHWYLAFLAVAPHRQGQGVGAALLHDRFAYLDANGQPAYLEASSPRNAALYAREGFSPTGVELGLPDGPALIPMWRKPVTAL